MQAAVHDEDLPVGLDRHTSGFLPQRPLRDVPEVRQERADAGHGIHPEQRPEISWAGGTWSSTRIFPLASTATP